MNFLITLDLSVNDAVDFSKQFIELLKKFELDSIDTLIDDTHTVIVTKPRTKAAEEPKTDDQPKVEEAEELSPEEAEKTPALNENDLCPHCGEAECECPGREHKCDKCKDDAPCKKCDDNEVKEAVLVDFGPCKVLTLSTQSTVNTKVDPLQESTVLYVKDASYEFDCEQVRFNFKMHEHVLPTFKGQNTLILNEGRINSPSAVRLVLEIMGTSYPSLVEIQVGSEDVLVIGSDLIEILQHKGPTDVPSK